MQEQSNVITLLLLASTFLILLMAGFILTIIFLYRRKLIAHSQYLNKIRENYEKNLLKAQLEIQEQIFQNISREIHDNISLSLTLAKLHLNTINWINKEQMFEKVELSISLLGQSINDLRNISKGLNSDTITQQGLIKALEFEAQRIRETKLFNVEFKVTGNPVYLDGKKELIVFRIVQEAFNNIIKHANATKAQIRLHYFQKRLFITVTDNGSGFDTEVPVQRNHAGLINMESRVSILKGVMKINSIPGTGTSIYFTIPFQ